jgi:hypothetical protein
MVDITKYLNESIFDEEDIMNNIDNKAEILKWFKKLTTDNVDDLEEAIPGFIKAIKKNKAKQVPSVNKMDYDSNYIVISELEEKKEYGVRINIYFLKGQENSYSWQGWRISLTDLGTYAPMTECRKLHLWVDKLDFAYDTQRHYVTMKKVYTFPKEWEYIINLIEQNARS